MTTWQLYGHCAKWALKAIGTIVLGGFALSLLNAKNWWEPLGGLALLIALATAWGVWAVEHIRPLGQRRLSSVSRR